MQNTKPTNKISDNSNVPIIFCDENDWVSVWDQEHDQLMIVQIKINVILATHKKNDDVKHLQAFQQEIDEDDHH